MQQTLTWKWIVAAAAMLVLAAVILLPAKHGAHAANIVYDAPYASDEDQSVKPSPFPEKPARHRAKPVETPAPSSDN